MEQLKTEKEDKGWKGYYEHTKGRPPREFLLRAMPFVKNKNEALDLGSGALNDARFLLSAGFNHVTAVDAEPVAQEDANSLPNDKISYTVSSFENFDFVSETYDLVNAQYSLPFNPKSTFPKVFEKIILSLKPGGIFTGQFFGINDSWNMSRPEMTFQTKEETERLLTGLKIIELEEKEFDKKTALGEQKHWHIFNIIAEK